MEHYQVSANTSIRPQNNKNVERRIFYLENVDLIKAHITSGKVSLMRYDNWSKDEPLLLERVKIKLRELDIDFFDYSGEFEPTALINKVEYIN